MTSTPTSLRHVRPVQPLHFPSSDPEWEMSESKRHARLCELLYQLFRRIAGATSSVGADQFVYYDGENPKKCLAPDAFLKLSVPDTLFESWKTWEHGAPELCVEVLSPSDTREFLPLKQKMVRYRALGVRELVVFDIDADIGKRLRVFDRLEGDLVERVIENETSPCLVLGGAKGVRFDWVIAAADELPTALRLATDGTLVQTPLEAQTAEVERLKSELEALKRR